MRALLKPRLQKKYAAFLFVVPLLVLTAMVEVSCPVCGGSGKVNNNQAMESVQISHVQAKELGVKRNTCGLFLVYSYQVIISLENAGPGTATGWLLLYLIDYAAGKPMDRQYTVVEIAGKTSVDVTYNVLFLSGTDEPRRTEVRAEVFQGEVPCQSCNGKGRVPLNAWPIVNGLKEKFIQLQQIEKPWSVPPWPIDLE